MKVTVFSQGTSRNAAISEVGQLLQSPSEIFWVDIIDCDDQEAQVLRDVFHFHPLAIEDTRNHRQRPKLEEYNGYLFLITNSVSQLDGKQVPTPDASISVHHDLEFREINVFVGRNYLVTVSNRDDYTIGECRRRIDNVGSAFPITVSYLLYTLLDVIVDEYFPIMDLFEEEIGELEDVILVSPKQEHLNRLFDLKHMLLHMWRVVWPQRDMLGTLTQPHVLNFSDQSSQYYLRDVGDHLLWIADMINTYRDTLTGLIDLYMSSVSNRLNRIVNRLTVMTIVIGVMTVVSGFYGMNFEQTWPHFKDPNGVPFVLILMAMLISILMLILRRVNRS